MTVHLNTHSKVNVSLPLITKERQKITLEIQEQQGKLKLNVHGAHPHNKALQRHIRDQHTRKMEATISPGIHFKGACSDFKKGLFLISCIFSGVMYPIHCHLTSVPNDPKKVSSSCELD